MEVFPKYFRRLVQQNASAIFPTPGRSAEPSSTYHLLVEQMQKIRRDVQQADKIKEALDTTEGDLFRYFDLSGFLDHFKLDPVSRFAQALALKDASKPEMRTKGELYFAYDGVQIADLSIFQPKQSFRTATCHSSNR